MDSAGGSLTLSYAICRSECTLNLPRRKSLRTYEKERRIKAEYLTYEVICRQDLTRCIKSVPLCFVDEHASPFGLFLSNIMLKRDFLFFMQALIQKH